MTMPRKPLTEEQKARKREREKIWRDSNKEKIKEKNRRYVAVNPTVFKDYYAANKERHLEVVAAYQRNNLDKVREKSRHHYRIRKAKGLKVRSDDPEGIRRRAANRRALQAADGVRMPRGFIPRLLLAQRCRCANCSCDIRNTYHLDHVQPLARGGKHEPGNLQLLCPTCNLKKHAKDPFDWAKENGRLL